MISSLAKKPESGGMPLIARNARTNANAVNGMNLRSPPIRAQVLVVLVAVDHRAGAEEERALVAGVRDAP